jgi:hypothetical protein
MQDRTSAYNKRHEPNLLLQRKPRTSAGVLLQHLLHRLPLQHRKVSCNGVQGCPAHVRHRRRILLGRDVVAAAAKVVPKLAIPAAAALQRNKASAAK